MKIVSILFFNISLFLVALASTLVVVANNNPYNSAPSVFVLFYGSLFFTLSSFLTLLLFFLKSRLFNKQYLLALYFPSLRQSIFISLAATVLSLLKGLKIFDWWIGLSIFFSIILLELFFEASSFRKRKIA